MKCLLQHYRDFNFSWPIKAAKVTGKCGQSVSCYFEPWLPIGIFFKKKLCLKHWSGLIKYQNCEGKIIILDAERIKGMNEGFQGVKG